MPNSTQHKENANNAIYLSFYHIKQTLHTTLADGLYIFGKTQRGSCCGKLAPAKPTMHYYGIWLHVCRFYTVVCDCQPSRHQQQSFHPVNHMFRCASGIFA